MQILFIASLGRACPGVLIRLQHLYFIRFYEKLKKKT